MAAINNAFDGCKILTGTIPYSQSALITRISNVAKTISEIAIEKLSVTAYPNPYDKQFSLSITSPVSGIAFIEFFNTSGTKIYEMKQTVRSNAESIATYSGPVHHGVLFYRIRVKDYKANGIVINPN